MGQRFREVIHHGVQLRQLPDALWRARRRTLLLVFGAGILAAIVALLLPRWFASGASFTIDEGQTPQLDASILSLGARFGLGTPPSNSPQFYADLLQSRSLHERLLMASFPVGDEGELRPLYEFFGRSSEFDPKVRDRALRALRQRFAASADPRTGIVYFELQGPNPRAVRLMADTVLHALDETVIAIRAKRASAERTFLEERWRALRDSLTAHEDTLRKFYESNRQITSPELQFEEIRLRREVERVQGVYAQIGQQLEHARIQEVRDTPALSIIDTPNEPSRKAAPHRRAIVLTAMVMAAVLALMWALWDVVLYQLRPARSTTSTRG